MIGNLNIGNLTLTLYDGIGIDGLILGSVTVTPFTNPVIFNFTNQNIILSNDSYTMKVLSVNSVPGWVKGGLSQPPGTLSSTAQENPHLSLSTWTYNYIIYLKPTSFYSIISPELSKKNQLLITPYDLLIIFTGPYYVTIYYNNRNNYTINAKLEIINQNDPWNDPLYGDLPQQYRPTTPTFRTSYINFKNYPKGINKITMLTMIHKQKFFPITTYNLIRDDNTLLISKKSQCLPSCGEQISLTPYIPSSDDLKITYTDDPNGVTIRSTVTINNTSNTIIRLNIYFTDTISGKFMSNTAYRDVYPGINTLSQSLFQVYVPSITYVVISQTTGTPIITKIIPCYPVCFPTASLITNPLKIIDKSYISQDITITPTYSFGDTTGIATLIDESGTKIDINGSNIPIIVTIPPYTTGTKTYTLTVSNLRAVPLSVTTSVSVPMIYSPSPTPSPSPIPRRATKYDITKCLPNSSSSGTTQVFNDKQIYPKNNPNLCLDIDTNNNNKLFLTSCNLMRSTQYWDTSYDGGFINNIGNIPKPPQSSWFLNDPDNIAYRTTGSSEYTINLQKNIQRDGINNTHYLRIPVKFPNPGFMDINGQFILTPPTLDYEQIILFIDRYYWINKAGIDYFNSISGNPIRKDATTQQKIIAVFTKFDFNPKGDIDWDTMISGLISRGAKDITPYVKSIQYTNLKPPSTNLISVSNKPFEIIPAGSPPPLFDPSLPVPKSLPFSSTNPGPKPAIIPREEIQIQNTVPVDQIPNEIKKLYPYYFYIDPISSDIKIKQTTTPFNMSDFSDPILTPGKQLYNIQLNEDGTITLPYFENMCLAYENNQLTLTCCENNSQKWGLRDLSY
jgi:hypothetical protein